MTRDVTAGRETPNLLAIIEAEFGLEAGKSFAATVGGTEITIPKNPKPHHELCQAVGFEIIAWLSRNYGFGKTIVPLGSAGMQRRKAAEARRLFLQGLSNNEIARRLGLHLRTIERQRRRFMAGAGAP